MESLTATITVACPDRRGLVAAITGFLAQYGANILDLSQHTDPFAGSFFMRVEFELAGMSLLRDELGPAFAPLAESLQMNWQLHFTDQPQNVAILVSKYDHCLYDLLLRHRAGDFQANLKLVISNHPDLEYIARDFGLEWHFLPLQPDKKGDQENRLLELLLSQRIELVVLARYMQILSPAFITQYPNRIINIHHSFLPAFAGGRPYHQAYDRGVKIIGATAHYATEDLDEGPIIAQDVLKVSHRDSVKDLLRRGRDLERLVLAQAVKAHLENRVLVFGKRTIVFD
jgi:formyltetrahydrofolate deformylase